MKSTHISVIASKVKGLFTKSKHKTDMQSGCDSRYPCETCRGERVAIIESCMCDGVVAPHRISTGQYICPGATIKAELVRHVEVPAGFLRLAIRALRSTGNEYAATALEDAMNKEDVNE